MADIGTLVVKMAAETAQLRAELDKVKKDTRDTGLSFNALGISLKQLGGLVGAVSFQQVVSQAIQAASALNDISVQTGISIQALQSLQLAATVSGSSLESVAGAVAKMQNNLISAGEGSAAASAALDKIGLSAQQILSLAPDQQFQQLAVAIANIQDPAGRTAAAIDIFGKSGASLIPTLVEVGTNAEAINEQFSRLGGPASDLAVQKVDELGDSFDVLTLSTKSLFIELTSVASGALTFLTKQLTETVGAIRILAGGGGEVEQLQKKLQILNDAKNSGIPYFLNFGYIEGQSAILGPDGLRKAISQVQGEINNLINSKKLLDAAGAVPGVEVDLSFLTTNVDAALKGFDPKTGKYAPPPKTAAQRRMEGVDARADTLDLTSLMTDNQLKEAIEKEHLDKMALMNYQFHQDKYLAMSEFQRLQFDIQQAFGLQTIEFEQIKSMSVLDIAGQMFTALGGAGSKFFKVQQGFAIANAIINTAQGITEALKLPFPASLAAAAKVAAMGAIQIAKIKATNTSGSGGAPSAGGGGSASAGVEAARAATQGNADQSQEGQKKVAQVIVNGNLFSGRETADWLIGQISEAVNDRDVVFMNGNSRQASVLGGG